MQKNHAHLTTEQLSAFLDKELSTQEQSLCQAHLTTCDSCQQQLEELQQTVLLIRALPQVPQPRSFVLPIESTIQNTAVAEQTTSIRQRAKLTAHRSLLSPRYVRTTMHLASTLVAVLGLFFILSGSMTIISYNTGDSQIASSFLVSQKAQVNNTPSNSKQVQPFTEPKSLSENLSQLPDATGRTTYSSSKPLAQLPTQKQASSASNTLQPKSTASSSNTQLGDSSQKSSQMQLLISFLNPDTPEGHLSLGLLLFIAGIASIVIVSRLGKQACKEE